MSETTSEKSPKHGAIFSHTDLVTMSVYYMLPEHLDFEDLKEKTKNVDGDVPEAESLLNQEEMIVEFLKSSQRCKIYGASDRFIQELAAFQNFPASHKYFPLKFTTPYYTTPVLYRSVKGERFVCKQDFHTILQYLVQETVPASKNHVISSLISIYLKSKEDVASERMRFRRFEISEFEVIRNDLRTTNYTHFDDSGALKSTFFNEDVLEKLRVDFGRIQENSADSENSISGKFLKLIPATTWSMAETQWIEKALEGEKNSESLNVYTETLICLYTNATLILKKLAKIVQKWAEPKEETATVIRVFEDGATRFVLKSELFEALKIEKISDFKDFDNTKLLKNPLKIRKINPKSKTKNLMSPPPTDGAFALPYDEALRKYHTLQTTQHVEFVRFPVVRTARRAIPMLGPPSSKCAHSQFYIPVVDGMLEILKSLIWGSRIFQMFEFEKKKAVYEIFADIAVVFDVQQTTPTLIRTARIRDLTSSFTTKCSFHEKLEFPPFCDPTKDHEITPEDLRIELENLKLLEFFPKIQDSAEPVLKALLDKNGPENSENYRKSTEIWFEAVENCQMICVMEIFPKLKAFLHAQKSCRRIAGLECETCEEFPSEDVTSSDKNSEFFGDSTEKFPDILGCRIAPRNLVKKTGCSDFKIPDHVVDSEDVENLEDVEICGNQEEEGKEDVKNSESVESKNSVSQDLEDVKNEIGRQKSRLEELTELHDLQHLEELQNRVDNLCVALEDRKTSLEMLECSLGESARNSKKCEARIKRLERDLSKEREKSQKLKKKNLEFSDFVHENTQLKKRIFEMEEAEQRVSKEHQNETAALARKVTERNSRIENLERELRKNQDRNEALKNIFATNAQLNEENERLKMKIFACETREAKMTEAYEKMKKTFQEDRFKFSERIADMARNLRCEKIKTSDVETTAAQLRRQVRSLEDTDRIDEIQSLKEDIREKRRYIELVLNTNSQLNEEAEKNRRKFRRISEILGSDGASSPPSHFAEAPAAKKGRSLILEENRLFESPPIPHVVPIGAERARRLNSIATVPATSSSSTVPLLATPPGLTLSTPSSSSSTPEEATTSSSTSPPRLPILLEPSELADSECVICLSEVRSTDKIIKCHECRRRFHGKCASDWLKVKSICPTCKGKLLDPDEFPAL